MNHYLEIYEVEFCVIFQDPIVNSLELEKDEIPFLFHLHIILDYLGETWLTPDLV